MIKFIKRYYGYIIFSFFSISIGAWFLEMLFSLIVRSKFVLPGTLSGPWCQIYGVTFILLLLFLKKKDNVLYNFVKIFLIATVVEYISSFISGEIFHNVIWDYSGYFLNINGRVCFGMSFLFALLGSFMMYFIEPWLRRLYIKLGGVIKVFNIVCTILFISDIIVNIFWI